MTSTAEKVRALADAGKTTREIATELGVSRQRIHEVASKNSISLPRHVYTPSSVPKPPKPRVRTGGIEVPISHAIAGSIAEMLVAADLLARGYHVYFPVMPSRGHDLIAVNGRQCHTIQVRSASRSLNGSVNYNQSREKTSDFYALVLVGEPVIYKPELPELPPRFVAPHVRRAVTLGPV